MLHPLVPLLLLLSVHSSISLRCHDYMRTNALQNNQRTWVDCPYEARFCFKSYVESIDFNGMATHIESRSCGTPDICQREGCRGDKRDRACCCRDDLCNGSAATGFISSVIAAAALLIMKM